MNNKIILSLVILSFLIVLPMVSAVTLDAGTVLNTTYSNSSVTIDSPVITVTQVVVENNGVALYGASWTNGLTATVTTVINWTTPRTNILSSQFPRVSSTSNNGRTITIASSLTQNIAGTFTYTINDNCDDINKITYLGTTYEGMAARAFCSNKVLTLNTINAGTNDLKYEIGTTSLASTAMKLILGFLAIAVLLFAVGGFMFYVKDDFRDVSTMEFIKYAVALLLVTVLIIVLINYIVSIL